MKSFIKAMDDLPLILKVILCIPMLDIIWSIYKLIKSVDNGNVFYIILGILVIFPGAAFIWIIDIITVIVSGKVWWIC
jgi:hypothetical protein